MPVLIEFLGIIVMTGIQVSSAVDGTGVGHLNDPRGCRTFGRIEDARFLEEKEKELLNKVFGLGFVSQDASGDVEDGPSVPLKQDGQRFFASLPYLHQKVFVRALPERTIDSNNRYNRSAIGLDNDGRRCRSRHVDVCDIPKSVREI